MEPITLIYMFLIVLTMRWYKSRKRRTYSFPLYSVVKHRKGPATLYMVFSQCPVGAGALEEIFIKLQATLVELQKLGFTRVKFTSHLLRPGTEKKLLSFLAHNCMSCERKRRYNTPLLHTFSNKIAMKYCKNKTVKVSATSMSITIKLQPAKET